MVFEALSLCRLCRADTGCLLSASVLAAVLLWPSPAHSAEASKTAPAELRAALPATAPILPSIYVTLGLGGGSVGLTARGLATVAYHNWFVGMTGAMSDELNFFGPSPSLEQQDLGAVGGLHLRGSYYVIALGAGLGYVHSVRRGQYLGEDDGGWFSGPVYEKIEERTIGFPLLAHAALYWGPIGLGAMAFANCNKTLPSVGAALTLNIGMF